MCYFIHGHWQMAHSFLSRPKSVHFRWQYKLYQMRIKMYIKNDSNEGYVIVEFFHMYFRVMQHIK